MFVNVGDKWGRKIPGSIGVSQYIFVQADESDADNTLHNDSELFFIVGQNENWAIDLFLLFTSGASNVPDCQITFTFPSGTLSGNATGLIAGATIATSLAFSTGAGLASPSNFGAFGVLTSATANASPVSFSLGLKTTTAGGIFQVQWAQNTTTGGTPTVRKAGSWMRYTRIN